MNNDQVQSLVRGALLAAGSVAVTKGLVDQSTLATIVGDTAQTAFSSRGA